MKIILRDFNATSREDIFKPTNGNESLPKLEMITELE
jgi:hypothetical protein